MNGKSLVNIAILCKSICTHIGGLVSMSYNDNLMKSNDFFNLMKNSDTLIRIVTHSIISVVPSLIAITTSFESTFTSCELFIKTFVYLKWKINSVFKRNPLFLFLLMEYKNLNTYVIWKFIFILFCLQWWIQIVTMKIIYLKLKKLRSIYRLLL